MKPDRILLIDDTGASRAPMAMAILQELLPDDSVSIEARGLKVLFEEPLNQKIRAVLAGNGIVISDDFASKQLTASDVTENTLLLAVSSANRHKILDRFPDLPQQNVRVLTEMAGEELEIVDPYGQPLQTYGLCFETMYRTLEKVAKLLEEEINERQA